MWNLIGRASLGGASWWVVDSRLVRALKPIPQISSILWAPSNVSLDNVTKVRHPPHCRSMSATSSLTPSLWKFWNIVMIVTTRKISFLVNTKIWDDPDNKKDLAFDMYALFVGEKVECSIQSTSMVSYVLEYLLLARGILAKTSNAAVNVVVRNDQALLLGIAVLWHHLGHQILKDRVAILLAVDFLI